MLVHSVSLCVCVCSVPCLTYSVFTSFGSSPSQEKASAPAENNNFDPSEGRESPRRNLPSGSGPAPPGGERKDLEERTSMALQGVRLSTSSLERGLDEHAKNRGALQRVART